MHKNEAIDRLRALRDELERRFSVLEIGIFGSVARDEADELSDVDVLVRFREPTFDHYMDLKFRLEEELGHRVDLVTHDALKPRLREQVMREVVYA